MNGPASTKPIIGTAALLEQFDVAGTMDTKEFILERYLSQLSTRRLPDVPEEASSEEVQELRHQLHQLSAELRTLRSNLKTDEKAGNLNEKEFPPSYDMQFPNFYIKNDKAAVVAGPNANRRGLPVEDDDVPPLPPRNYRDRPDKPQRTFVHGKKEIVIPPNPELNYHTPQPSPMRPLSSPIDSYGAPPPPYVPPKSPKVLQKTYNRFLPSTSLESLNHNQGFASGGYNVPSSGTRSGEQRSIYNHPSPTSTQNRSIASQIYTNGSLSGSMQRRSSTHLERKMPNQTVTKIKLDTRSNLKSSKSENVDENLENFILQTLDREFKEGIVWHKLGPVQIFINSFDDTTASSLSLLHVANNVSTNKVIRNFVGGVLTKFREIDLSQSIVLNGESGSGKSHIAMQLIRDLCRSFSTQGNLNMNCTVFQHLAASVSVLNPLTAARSQTNFTSSQVATLYELHISENMLSKAKIYCCFLDQSRLCRQISGETNYQIFYQMLAGLSPDEKVKFHLNDQNTSNLYYLNQNEYIQTNSIVDAEMFLHWKVALYSLGITFSDIMRVLSAVLLLGNIHFTESSEAGELDINGMKELESVAALLGVTGMALYRGLTKLTRTSKNQTVRVNATSSTANATRDVLAKTLFFRCIGAIVKRANTQLPKPNFSNSFSCTSSSDESSVHDSGIGLTGRNSSNQPLDGTISVLDMFGFVHAKHNHFEHLCHNYASEKLQQFYQTNILHKNNQLMKEQKINCDLNFSLPVNSAVIDLYLSPKSGIFRLLDEQAESVSGSTLQFIQTLKSHRKSDKCVEFCDNTQSFVVHHYGGSVINYAANDFVSINRNQCPSDCMRVFGRGSCNFGFASYLFQADLKVLEEQSVHQRRSRVMPSTMMDNVAEVTSFCQDFTFHIDTFLKSLAATNVHFIQCIKSNSDAKYRQFDCNDVLRQMRRLDILPTAQYLGSGLPYNMRLSEFNSRYQFLTKRYNRFNESQATTDAEESQNIMECFLKAVDDSNMPYVCNPTAVGTEHIFLSEGAYEQLESLRQNYHSPQMNAALRQQDQLSCSSLHSPNTSPYQTAIKYDRPQPMVESNDHCAANPIYLRKANSMLGLENMDQNSPSPPPMPTARRYTIEGKRKISFPQRRVMISEFADADNGDLKLQKGAVVKVIGWSPRAGHVLVDCGRFGTLSVPYTFMQPNLIH